MKKKQQEKLLEKIDKYCAKITRKLDKIDNLQSDIACLIDDIYFTVEAAGNEDSK